jgi:predicted nucleic acid-binding protein
VIDASVAFKWLIPESSEEDVPAAKRLLLDHLEGRAAIIIPALLYYEVGNILLFGRSRPPLEQAAEVLAAFHAIPLEVAPVNPLSADMTLRLASLHGLSFYDATYVALAEISDCPLITADRRLVERARPTGRVHLLGEDLP